MGRGIYRDAIAHNNKEKARSALVLLGGGAESNVSPVNTASPRLSQLAEI